MWPSACRGLESKCQTGCGRVLVEDWSPDVRQGVAERLSRTGVQMSDMVWPSACRGLESRCQTGCGRVLVENWSPDVRHGVAVCLSRTVVKVPVGLEI